MPTTVRLADADYLIPDPIETTVTDYGWRLAVSVPGPTGGWQYGFTLRREATTSRAQQVCERLLNRLAQRLAAGEPVHPLAR